MCAYSTSRLRHGSTHLLCQNQGTRRVLNEALYLRCLEEHASFSIPIKAPQYWPEHAWMGLNFPKVDITIFFE